MGGEIGCGVHVERPVRPWNDNKLPLVGECHPLRAPVPVEKEELSEQSPGKERGDPGSSAVPAGDRGARTPGESTHQRIEVFPRQPGLVAREKKNAVARRGKPPDSGPDRRADPLVPLRVLKHPHAEPVELPAHRRGVVAEEGDHLRGVRSARNHGGAAE